MYLFQGLYKETTSALATVRVCLCCPQRHTAHAEIVRKGLPGVGRGYGLREGNKARGRMIQHIKTAHPEQYAANVAAFRAQQAARGAS